VKNLLKYILTNVDISGMIISVVYTDPHPRDPIAAHIICVDNEKGETTQ